MDDTTDSTRRLLKAKIDQLESLILETVKEVDRLQAYMDELPEPAKLTIRKGAG